MQTIFTHSICSSRWVRKQHHCALWSPPYFNHWPRNSYSTAPPSFSHVSTTWNCRYLIGTLPTRRDARGSATDRHGLVISSNTDGAMYVKPYNQTTAIMNGKTRQNINANGEISMHYPTVFSYRHLTYNREKCVFAVLIIYYQYIITSAKISK